MNLIEKVKNTITTYHLFSKGDKVLVGVSAGPDSVALLYILHALRYELAIDLQAAHFNHQLRKESVDDARFVNRLAKGLRLPFLSAAWGNRKKGGKGSLEELAREARFDFFMNTARKTKADVIALGHTMNDLAETVLMRILRGTGLQGLRSILAKREIEGYCFIRPLLDVQRPEILRFLEKGHIEYRHDSSNTQLKFFRNKIRLQLLPLLEREYNPNVVATLAHLARSVSYDYDYLEANVKGLFSRLARVKKENPRVMISMEAFMRQPPSLRNMLLRLAVARLKGNTNRMTFAHIEEIESLLAHRPQGAVVHFPGGIQITKHRKYLTITLKKSLNK